MWYLNRRFQAGTTTLTLQHGWYETVRSFSLSLSLSLIHYTRLTQQYDINFTKKNVKKEKDKRFQENQKMGRYEKSNFTRMRERNRSLFEKEQGSGKEILDEVQI